MLTLPTVVFLDCADTTHCGLSVLLVAGSRISPLAYSKGKDDRQYSTVALKLSSVLETLFKDVIVYTEITYRTDHACHQKSTPSRETVPLSYSYEIGYLF